MLFQEYGYVRGHGGQGQKTDRGDDGIGEAQAQRPAATQDSYRVIPRGNILSEHQPRAAKLTVKDVSCDRRDGHVSHYTSADCTLSDMTAECQVWDCRLHQREQ